MGGMFFFAWRLEGRVEVFKRGVVSDRAGALGIKKKKRGGREVGGGSRHSRAERSRQLRQGIIMLGNS